MKRVIIFVMVAFITLSVQPLCATVVWQGDFEQFRFAVEDNGGAFFYPDDLYLAPNSQAKAEFAYNPSQSYTDSYDSVALATLLEFVDPPGEIQLDALARGPDGGQNPSNGLAVNGALEITGVDLDYAQEHGVDIKQKVVTFVTRRLEVDLDGTYTLDCLLSGLDNLIFNSFFSGDDHRAAYSIEAVVSLERIVYDENLFETMQGFPIQLTEADPIQKVDVPLTKQNENSKDVGYQLKVQLTMQAEIDNLYNRTFSIQGALDEYYAIGSVDAPINLRAVFSDPNDLDTDGDGVPDSIDNCPNEPNADQADDDGDGVGDACDGCPQDPDKSDPGTCGCGVPDTDSDTDGTPDCIDNCPNDPEKTDPGLCGCGVVDSDTDTDTDGVIDCLDAFPDDPEEWADFDEDGEGDNSDPDDDNDGMPDEWEISYNLDPYDAMDAADDKDGDGWINLDEYKNGTDPNDPEDFPVIKNTAMPWIPLLLLSDNVPEPEPINCDELIADNCNLPAPDNLAFAVENDEFGNTFIRFTWSPVDCALYYFIRVGIVENLKDLPIEDPNYKESATIETSWRANFTEADAGVYYWTVASGCSDSPVVRGAWSVEENFNF